MWISLTKYIWKYVYSLSDLNISRSENESLISDIVYMKVYGVINEYFTYNLY